jgi:C_GCAxxG_C_C family probable redox protein
MLRCASRSSKPLSGADLVDEEERMSKEIEVPTEADVQSSVINRAKELLLASGNCAQTSFAILNEDFDLEGEQILKALTPFPGIALRGETCGAVTGSLMALGLVYGRDDMNDWKGYIGSLPSARRFCRQFEEQNGSTVCAAILQEKLGQTFDLADQVQALEYANAGGPDACSEVVASAITIASNGLVKKIKSSQ